MIFRNLAFLLIGLICFSCGQVGKKTDTTTEDKTQIKEVLIKVLKWHDDNGTFIGFEPIFSADDSLAIGMDLQILEKALNTFNKTNLFHEDFIDNYGLIVRAIDEKIKNKEMVFMECDMPPYDGADPWCSCQDIPYENPWDKIVVTLESLKNDEAILTWTWGESDWSVNFDYRVRAKKTNGTWKISYLEGFDYYELTQ